MPELSVVALSMRGLFGVAGWTALVVVPATSSVCVAVLVRQPISRWAARRRHRDTLVGVRYRAGNGDVFEFDFEFWPRQGWQALILGQPDYSGHAYDPVEQPDEARRAGCGDRTAHSLGRAPPTYQDARARAARWAGIDSEIRAGRDLRPGPARISGRLLGAAGAGYGGAA